MTLVDVVLVLRAPPRALFYGAGQGLPTPNRIRLRLQPDTGVTFALLAKRPGGGDVATEIPVSVDFRTALGAAERPYERIQADALAGDPAHFARMDNVEEAWRIVGPALDLGTEAPPVSGWGAGDQRRLTRCPASAAGSHSQTRRITDHHHCQPDVSALPGIS